MKIRNLKEESPYNLSHYALHPIVSCPLTHGCHQYRCQVFKVLQHLDDLDGGTWGRTDVRTCGQMKRWAERGLTY